MSASQSVHVYRIKNTVYDEKWLTSVWASSLGDVAQEMEITYINIYLIQWDYTTPAHCNTHHIPGPGFVLGYGYFTVFKSTLLVYLHDQTGYTTKNMYHVESPVDKHKPLHLFYFIWRHKTITSKVSCKYIFHRLQEYILEEGGQLETGN